MNYLVQEAEGNLVFGLNADYPQLRKADSQSTEDVVWDLLNLDGNDCFFKKIVRQTAQKSYTHVHSRLFGLCFSTRSISGIQVMREHC